MHFESECKVVTQVQLANSVCILPESCLSWLSMMHFSCKLLTSNNMISHLQRLQNALTLWDFAIFVIFEKITCAYHHQKTLKMLPILTCLVSV